MQRSSSAMSPANPAASSGAASSSSSQLPRATPGLSRAASLALLDARIEQLKAAQEQRRAIGATGMTNAAAAAASESAAGGAAAAAGAAANDNMPSRGPVFGRAVSLGSGLHFSSRPHHSVAAAAAAADAAHWAPERLMARTARTDVLLRIEIAPTPAERAAEAANAVHNAADAAAAAAAAAVWPDGSPMHSSSSFSKQLPAAAMYPSVMPAAAAATSDGSLAVPSSGTGSGSGSSLALKREISPSLLQGGSSSGQGSSLTQNGSATEAHKDKRQRVGERAQQLPEDAAASSAATAAAASSSSAAAAAAIGTKKPAREAKSLDDDDDDEGDVEMSDAPSPAALAAQAALESSRAAFELALAHDASHPSSRVVHLLWAESSALTSASHYFATMLSSGSQWAERRQGVVTLPVPDRDTAHLLANLLASIVVDDRRAQAIAERRRRRKLANVQGGGAAAATVDDDVAPPSASFRRSASAITAAEHRSSASAAAMDDPALSLPPSSSSPLNPLLHGWTRRLRMLSLAHFYMMERQVRLLCHLLGRDLAPTHSRLQRVQELLFEQQRPAANTHAVPPPSSAGAANGTGQQTLGGGLLMMPSLSSGGAGGGGGVIPEELRGVPAVRRLLSLARRRFLEFWMEVSTLTDEERGQGHSRSKRRNNDGNGMAVQKKDTGKKLGDLFASLAANSHSNNGNHMTDVAAAASEIVAKSTLGATSSPLLTSDSALSDTRMPDEDRGDSDDDSEEDAAFAEDEEDLPELATLVTGVQVSGCPCACARCQAMKAAAEKGQSADTPLGAGDAGAAAPTIAAAGAATAAAASAAPGSHPPHRCISSHHHAVHDRLNSFSSSSSSSSSLLPPTPLLRRHCNFHNRFWLDKQSFAGLSLPALRYLFASKHLAGSVDEVPSPVTLRLMSRAAAAGTSSAAVPQVLPNPFVSFSLDSPNTIYLALRLWVMHNHPWFVWQERCKVQQEKQRQAQAAPLGAASALTSASASASASSSSSYQPRRMLLRPNPSTAEVSEDRALISHWVALEPQFLSLLRSCVPYGRLDADFLLNHCAARKTMPAPLDSSSSGPGGAAAAAPFAIGGEVFADDASSSSADLDDSVMSSSTSCFFASVPCVSAFPAAFMRAALDEERRRHQERLLALRQGKPLAPLFPKTSSPSPFSSSNGLALAGGVDDAADPDDVAFFVAASQSHSSNGAQSSAPAVVLGPALVHSRGMCSCCVSRRAWVSSAVSQALAANVQSDHRRDDLARAKAQQDARREQELAIKLGIVQAEQEAEMAEATRANGTASANGASASGSGSADRSASAAAPSLNHSERACHQCHAEVSELRHLACPCGALLCQECWARQVARAPSVDQQKCFRCQLPTNLAAAVRLKTPEAEPAPPAAAGAGATLSSSASAGNNAFGRRYGIRHLMLRHALHQEEARMMWEAQAAAAQLHHHQQQQNPRHPLHRHQQQQQQRRLVDNDDDEYSDDDDDGGGHGDYIRHLFASQAREAAMPWIGRRSAAAASTSAALSSAAAAAGVGPRAAHRSSQPEDGDTELQRALLESLHDRVADIASGAAAAAAMARRDSAAAGSSTTGAAAAMSSLATLAATSSAAVRSSSSATPRRPPIPRSGASAAAAAFAASASTFASTAGAASSGRGAGAGSGASAAAATATGAARVRRLGVLTGASLSSSASGAAARSSSSSGGGGAGGAAAAASSGSASGATASRRPQHHPALRTPNRDHPVHSSSNNRNSNGGGSRALSFLPDFHWAHFEAAAAANAERDPDGPDELRQQQQQRWLQLLQEQDARSLREEAATATATASHHLLQHRFLDATSSLVQFPPESFFRITDNDDDDDHHPDDDDDDAEAMLVRHLLFQQQEGAHAPDAQSITGGGDSAGAAMAARNDMAAMLLARRERQRMQMLQLGGAATRANDAMQRGAWMAHAGMRHHPTNLAGDGDGAAAGGGGGGGAAAAANNANAAAAASFASLSPFSGARAPLSILTGAPMRRGVLGNTAAVRSSESELQVQLVEADFLSLVTEGRIAGDRTMVRGLLVQPVLRIVLRGMSVQESAEHIQALVRSSMDVGGAGASSSLSSARNGGAAASAAAASSASNAFASPEPTVLSEHARTFIMQNGVLQVGLALLVGPSGLCQANLFPPLRILSARGREVTALAGAGDAEDEHGNALAFGSSSSRSNGFGHQHHVDSAPSEALLRELQRDEARYASASIAASSSSFMSDDLAAYPALDGAAAGGAGRSSSSFSSSSPVHSCSMPGSTCHWCVCLHLCVSASFSSNPDAGTGAPLKFPAELNCDRDEKDVTASGGSRSRVRTDDEARRRSAAAADTGVGASEDRSSVDLHVVSSTSGWETLSKPSRVVFTAATVPLPVPPPLSPSTAFANGGSGGGSGSGSARAQAPTPMAWVVPSRLGSTSLLPLLAHLRPHDRLLLRLSVEVEGQRQVTQPF